MSVLRVHWATLLLATGWGIVAVSAPAIAGIALLIGSVVIAALISPIATLATALVIGPIRTLFATEASFSLPLDAGLLLLMCFIGVYVAQRITHKIPLFPQRSHIIYLPFILILSIFGLNILAATSISAWLNEWLKWLIMFGIVILLLNSINEKSWRWIIFILAAAASANAIVGLYIFLGGSGADHLLILRRFYRAFGTFGQPNPFGGFMGLLLPVFAAMALGSFVDYWQALRHKGELSATALLSSVYYSSVSALGLAAIVASWSRGAWLGLVASAGVMIFALPEKNWQRLSLTALGLGALLGIWYSGFLPQSVVLRITSSTEEFFAFEDVRGVDITSANYAVVERLAHWQAALNMTQANPWIGVGLGNYEVVYPQYQLQNWSEPLGHAHNYYLNVLAEAGIIGLSAYAIFWGWIVWLTWRIKSHPDFTVRLVAAGLLGSWAYFAVHSVFDNLFVNNLFLHLGSLFAIVALLHQQMIPGRPVRRILLKE